MLRLVAVVYLIAAIGSASGGDSAARVTSPAEVASETAACSAAVIGEVPAGARQPIRFLEYRGALDGAVRSKSGLWSVKLGAAIRGDEPVTVTVARRQQDNAALVYGSHVAALQVRFEPCEGQRSTGWAGSLKLVARKPVTVEIRVAGKRPTREVLLDL